MATVRRSTASQRADRPASEERRPKLTRAEDQLDEFFRQRSMHRRVALFSRRRVIEVVGRHRVRRTRAWQRFEQVVRHQRRARPRRLDDTGIGCAVRDTAIIVVVWGSRAS